MSVLVIPEESTTTTTIVELVYSRREVEIYVRARTRRLGYLSTHTVSLLSYFFVVFFFSTWSSKRKKRRSREGERRAVKWRILWWFLVDFFLLTFIYTFFFLWCIDVEWDEINFRLFFHPLISSLLLLLFSNQINWNLKFPFGFIAAIKMFWAFKGLECPAWNLEGNLY